MDANQFGPNINTTPVQRYVRDGPYHIAYWVKQCLYISKVMYSIPRWGNLQDPRHG